MTMSKVYRVVTLSTLNLSCLGGSMSRIFFWPTSTVGKKILIAVTGCILFCFLFVHLVGNLQIFLGEEAVNRYSALLHTIPELLWVARFVLLACIAAHIVASIQVTWENWNARPIRYVHRAADAATTYAARTMIWSGPIVAAFIVYHILHLTTGTVTIGYDHDVHDVYGNLIAGFQVWYVSVGYLVALCMVCFHLWHGIWSWTQTLGLSHPKWNELRSKLATGVSIFMAVGFLIIPLAVLTGIVD